MSTIIALKEGNRLVLATDSRRMNYDLSAVESSTVEKIFELRPQTFLAQMGRQLVTDLEMKKARELARDTADVRELAQALGRELQPALLETAATLADARCGSREISATLAGEIPLHRFLLAGCSGGSLGWVYRNFYLEGGQIVPKSGEYFGTGRRVYVTDGPALAHLARDPRTHRDEAVSVVRRFLAEMRRADRCVGGCDQIVLIDGAEVQWVSRPGSGILRPILQHAAALFAAGMLVIIPCQAASAIRAEDAVFTSGAIQTADIGNLQVKTANIDNLAVTEFKIGALAVTNAKIADATITEAKISTLSVGGGAGRPGKITVYNAAGTLIGFFGTDSGDDGGWVKTLSVGGTSYANGKLKADASGNVTIADAGITINGPNDVVTINTASGFKTKHEAATLDYIIEVNTGSIYARQKIRATGVDDSLAAYYSTGFQATQYAGGVPKASVTLSADSGDAHLDIVDTSGTRRVYFYAGATNYANFICPIQVNGVEVIDINRNIITGAAWNGNHVRMGSYHLWVDSTGDLRIKSGAPTSDTDGTIVGTQS